MDEPGKTHKKQTSRKTKAQLEAQLAEVTNELATKVRALSSCRNELKSAEKELTTLPHVQMQLSSTEDRLAHSLENTKTLTARLATTENQLRDFTKRYRRLQREEQTEEAEASTAAPDMSIPRTTFRIDLYPRDGEYHGRIEHSLSRDRKTFTGLGEEAITDFIAAHISPLQPETPTPPRNASDDVAAARRNAVVISSAQRHDGVIQEVAIEQANRQLDSGDPIRPGKPFIVHTKLRLPEIPATGLSDTVAPTYGVRLVLERLADHRVLLAENSADDVRPGITEYDEAIPVRTLPSGEYKLNVSTIVPFAHIGDQRSIAVVVG